jgi:hypothetical protein
MMNRLRSLRVLTRAGVGLAMAGLFFPTVPWTCAQSMLNSVAEGARSAKDRALPGGYPQKPSQPVLWSIPVEPLGFSAPGALYLGQRNSLVSLDFIDENRLLFTFRVPGLIHRDLKAGEGADSDERRIRAVVLTLPDGNVEAEGLWTVHDRSRYLWMLKDGNFLLRDKENLQQGDARLNVKPLLQFPGSLLGLELDPSQQYIVANSFEPAASPGAPGQVGSPATAAVTVTEDSEGGTGASSSESNGEETPAPPKSVVRILRRETGQVMLVSRVRAAVHLPINSEGYVESLRGRGEQWTMNLKYFSGGSRELGLVESTCMPTVDFTSQQVVLVTACTESGGRKLLALTTGGRMLWSDLVSDTTIWPLLGRSAGGLRLMHETLAVTHPVNAYAPLGSDDIKGQVVRILDVATGEIAFESPASPILDAGGNAAISPSGKRVAVLNAGAIQVFELPAPPMLPDAGAKLPSH